MDFNNTCNDFEQYLTQVRGRAVSTSRAYDHDLARFTDWLSQRGITQPKDVTTRVIEDYLQPLDCSMARKARIRSSISTFFSFLMNRGIINANPADRLESIKLPTKEPVYLTPQQCLAFLAAVTKTTPYFRHRDMAIMKLLLKSGLRRAEVISLNIEDVDLNHGSMRITRKGNKQQVLPLHPDLVADLTAYIEHENRHSGPLFMSKRGNRLSAVELWHLVKKYAKAAGLSKTVTVHSLRHSFASTLLGQNVSTSYIQSLMGHQHLSTTARYLHFQDQQLRAALEEVNF